MNKLAIFTIILAVSVATVTFDLAVREQAEKPSVEEFQASVLEEEPATQEKTHEPEPPSILVARQELIPPKPDNSKVTQEFITQSGFKGSLAEKHFNGKVYQLLDITQIPVAGMGFYEIVQGEGPVASVTEIVLGDEIRALQMYVLLQNKTKPYIDVSLNETNAYGDRSFYINHAKKPSEAFLTVKIGNRIYAIAYVKVFHPEIKKLIQLLT